MRLIVEYDGAEFKGWQRQKDVRTVQEELERALAVFFGKERVPVVAAGRTDTGVHALEQVVSFVVPHGKPFNPFQTQDLRRLLRGLNGLLPEDVAVKEVAFMPKGFHARRHSAGKLYRYLVLDGTAPSPLLRKYVWHVPQNLDVDAMREASLYLLGEHDFASFKGRGSSVKTTVRTITDLQIFRTPENPHLIRFEVAGTGFLKHMVRNIVGTLVEVGLGKRPPEQMKEILEAKNRDAAGPTAPGAGLTLVKVKLKPPFDKPINRYPQ